MKWVSILFFSIAIISCSNVTLEKDPIVIDSIKDGTVLSTGDIFEINIDRNSDSVGVVPTSTKVYIKRVPDGSRSIIDVIPIELEVDFEKNPNPKFKITDDFEDGLYNLTIHIFENDELITEKVTEFIIFSGQLKGDIFGSYPSKIYSDSKVILKTSFLKDPSTDPYLIWRFDNRILEEGYLSEGLDSIIWDSGSIVGFNNIRVDIYPYKLSDNTIKSDNHVDFSILVNPYSKNLYSYELLKSYYKSMFFNGNYIDENNKDLVIRQIGEIHPELRGDFYGIIIDDKMGFSVNDSLIPVGSRGFMSFSIILDLVFNSENDDVFLNNRHGSLNFDIEIKDGDLINSFYWKELILASFKVEDIVSTSPARLNITFIRNDNGFDLLYYLNGKLAGRNTLELNPEQLKSFSDEDRELTLSGSSLLIDTLKVYYMDTDGNNNIYPFNIEDRDEDHLTYSFVEGFNSLVLPSNISGLASIDGEVLTLEKGAVLDYSRLLDHSEDYTLEVLLSGDGLYRLLLIGRESEMSLELSGSLVLKKHSDSLLLNDRLLKSWPEDITGFKIISENSVLLDSVTLISRDKSFE